ncbi:MULTISPECIES: competence pheromone ComX [Bacillus]|uniref:competence pheromone ComX n=1 Tax=Bacillus TaxID=1386 RepID=UPI00045C3EDE|nr:MULTISPECIES: competence pheromone ComX [Bacillus]KDE31932.1 competence pheromone precursor ComX [Bacillus altitudinis 41KF2b]MCA0120126.1 competence pheromone ComX [Bacillus sp. RSS_NA_20]MCY7530074.1 competence pheromone ComX [Bacillus altitudinis]MEC1041821.1 competence pheromone ComX [Bacillus altitudinis]MEC1090091.1 competence pheromone ComX [Bacillus altitudinis]
MSIQNVIAYLVKNPSVVNELDLGNASLIHTDEETMKAIIQGIKKGQMSADYIWYYK